MDGKKNQSSKLALAIMCVVVTSTLFFIAKNYFCAILSQSLQNEPMRVWIYSFAMLATLIGSIFFYKKKKLVSIFLLFLILIVNIFTFIYTPSLTNAQTGSSNRAFYLPNKQRTLYAMAVEPESRTSTSAASSAMLSIHLQEVLYQDRLLILPLQLKDTDDAKNILSGWSAHKDNSIYQDIPDLPQKTAEEFLQKSPLHLIYQYPEFQRNYWLLVDENWEKSSKLYVMICGEDLWVIPEQSIDLLSLPENKTVKWNDHRSLNTVMFDENGNTLYQEIAETKESLYGSLGASFILFMIAGWLLLLPVSKELGNILHPLLSPLAGVMFNLFITLLLALLPIPYSSITVVLLSIILLSLWLIIFFHKNSIGLKSYSSVKNYKQQIFPIVLSLSVYIIFVIFPFYTTHGDSMRSMRMGFLLAKTGHIYDYLLSELLGHGWYITSVTALNAAFGGDFNYAITPTLTVLFIFTFGFFLYQHALKSHVNKTNTALITISVCSILCLNTMFLLNAVLLMNNLFTGIVLSSFFICLYAMAGKKVTNPFIVPTLSFILSAFALLRVENPLFTIAILVCILYSKGFDTFTIKKITLIVLFVVISIQLLYIFTVGSKTDGRFWTVERGYLISALSLAYAVYLMVENYIKLPIVQYLDLIMCGILSIGIIIFSIIHPERAGINFPVIISSMLFSSWGAAWFSVFILIIAILLNGKTHCSLPLTIGYSFMSLLFLTFLMREGTLRTDPTDSSIRMLAHILPTILILSSVALDDTLKENC